jgi:Rieske Fe-S protein
LHHRRGCISGPKYLKSSVPLRTISCIKVINFLTLKQIAMLLEIHTRERNVHQYNAICKHLGNSPLKIHLIYKTLVWISNNIAICLSVKKLMTLIRTSDKYKIFYYRPSIHCVLNIKCIEHITSLRQRNSQYKWNHQMRVM